MAEQHQISTLRAGEPKPEPFTIVIVANPVLETPWNSGAFAADAMPLQPAAFQTAAQYILDCLEGTLPGQAEKLLSDPRLAGKVRVVSLLVTGCSVADANCLVGESVFGQLLAPRQTSFRPFLQRFGLEADIVFAVSASTRFQRESAFPADDDTSRPFTSYTLDGTSFRHCHFSQEPGVVAMHASSGSLTPLHEFSHALSSKTNGVIGDLYFANTQARVNVKVRSAGTAIPNAFATYDGMAFLSDLTRDGLGYPPQWLSYHCQLHDPSRPAAMDNYFLSATPLACQHDRITRQFLLDRLVAKVNR